MESTTKRNLQWTGTDPIVERRVFSSHFLLAGEGSDVSHPLTTASTTPGLSLEEGDQELVGATDGKGSDGLSDCQKHRRRDGCATAGVLVKQRSVVHLRGDQNNGSFAFDGSFGGPHGLSSKRLAVSFTDARGRVHLIGTHVAVHINNVRVSVASVDVAHSLLEQLPVKTERKTHERDSGEVGHMAHSHGKIHVKQVRSTGVPLVVRMESDIDGWRAHTIGSRGKRRKPFSLLGDSRQIGYGSFISTHNNAHHRLVFNRFQDHTFYR